MAVGELEISRIARLAAQSGDVDERQAAGLFASREIAWERPGSGPGPAIPSMCGQPVRANRVRAGFRGT